MKIKLETLVNASEALGQLAGKELGVTTAYKIARLIKACNAELQTYNEARENLLKSVGATLNDGGTLYNIPEDKREEFSRDYSELLSTEIELNADKIDLSNEKISIAPGLLLTLEDFIIIE